MVAPAMTRLPAAPILALIDARGGPSEVLDKAMRRAYHRAQYEGTVTWSSADRLALAIGLHPVEVWGVHAWLEVA